MTSSALTGASASSASDAVLDGHSTLTRTLLACGVVAGPFYLAVGVIQGFLRDGFDFSRHALSHLANGPGGWVQTVNFLVTGLLVIAAAIGIARALRPRSRAGSWILGLYGASMIVAAVFQADPVDGFPPGTPDGVPSTVSTAGMLHFAAGGLGFLALAVSCFVLARALSRRNQRSMAGVSLVTGLAVIAGFLGPMALPTMSLGMAAIWFSVVVGWLWLALISIHLRRGVDAPSSA